MILCNFLFNLQYILIRKCGGNCIICEHVFGNQKWIHGFAFMEHALFDREFVGLPKCRFLYWMRSMVHNLFEWCGQLDCSFFFQFNDALLLYLTEISTVLHIMSFLYCHVSILCGLRRLWCCVWIPLTFNLLVEANEHLAASNCVMGSCHNLSSFYSWLLPEAVSLDDLFRLAWGDYGVAEVKMMAQFLLHMYIWTHRFYPINILLVCPFWRQH